MHPDSIVFWSKSSLGFIVIVQYNIIILHIVGPVLLLNVMLNIISHLIFTVKSGF